jgi:hypothetical protein
MDKRIIKPRKRLTNGNIRDIKELNYYNDVPVGVNIIENKFEPKLFNNYSGNKNIYTVKAPLLNPQSQTRARRAVKDLRGAFRPRRGRPRPGDGQEPSWDL